MFSFRRITKKAIKNQPNTTRAGTEVVFGQPLTEKKIRREEKKKQIKMLKKQAKQEKKMAMDEE